MNRGLIDLGPKADGPLLHFVVQRLVFGEHRVAVFLEDLLFVPEVRGSIAGQSVEHRPKDRAVVVAIDGLTQVVDHADDLLVLGVY